MRWVLVYVALLLVILSPVAASADTLADRAGQMADGAFVLLNSLNNAESGKYSGGPMLAPAADLASNVLAATGAVGQDHGMARDDGDRDNHRRTHAGRLREDLVTENQAAESDKVEVPVQFRFRNFGEPSTEVRAGSITSTE